MTSARTLHSKLSVISPRGLQTPIKNNGMSLNPKQIQIDADYPQEVINI